MVFEISFELIDTSFAVPTRTYNLLQFIPKKKHLYVSLCNFEYVFVHIPNEFLN